MTVTIERTALCICHHIYSRHDQGADEACTACARCARFQLTSRKSSSHYQRGAATQRRKVARLRPGDRVLVGFPGHDEWVRGRSGDLVWVQEAGQITSHPLARHIEDEVLRPVGQKTDALVAKVVEIRRHEHGGVTVVTDLGELDVPVHLSVTVVTEPPPW